MELLYMSIDNVTLAGYPSKNYDRIDGLFDMKSIKKVYDNSNINFDFFVYHIESKYSDISIQVIIESDKVLDSFGNMGNIILFEFYEGDILSNRIEVEMFYGKNSKTQINGIDQYDFGNISKVRELNNFFLLFTKDNHMDELEYEVIEDLLLSLNNIVYSQGLLDNRHHFHFGLVHKSEKEIKQLEMDYLLSR